MPLTIVFADPSNNDSGKFGVTFYVLLALQPIVGVQVGSTLLVHRFLDTHILPRDHAAPATRRRWPAPWCRLKGCLRSPSHRSRCPRRRRRCTRILPAFLSGSPLPERAEPPSGACPRRRGRWQAPVDASRSARISQRIARAARRGILRRGSISRRDAMATSGRTRSYRCRRARPP